MRRPRSQQQFMRRSLYTARRRRHTVAGASCVNRKTIQRRILNGGEIVGNKRGGRETNRYGSELRLQFTLCMLETLPRT